MSRFLWFTVYRVVQKKCTKFNTP